MGPSLWQTNLQRQENNQKEKKRGNANAKRWPETVEFTPRAQVRAAGSGQKLKHKQTCARRLQVRSSNSGQLTCPSLSAKERKRTTKQPYNKRTRRPTKVFFIGWAVPPMSCKRYYYCYIFFFRFWGCPVPGCLTRHGYEKHRDFFLNGRYRMQESKKSVKGEHWLRYNMLEQK